MSYQQNSGSDRQMYQGNWKCAQCGTQITSLPFQPDPSREGSLTCRDCHKSQMGDRPARTGGRPQFGGNRPRFGGNRPQQDRQMYQGNWKCAQCGTSITQLPFRPDPSRESSILCRDCYKK